MDHQSRLGEKISRIQGRAHFGLLSGESLWQADGVSGGGGDGCCCGGINASRCALARSQQLQSARHIYINVYHHISLKRSLSVATMGSEMCCCVSVCYSLQCLHSLKAESLSSFHSFGCWWLSAVAWRRPLPRPQIATLGPRLWSRSQRPQPVALAAGWTI